MSTCIVHFLVSSFSFSSSSSISSSSSSSFSISCFRCRSYLNPIRTCVVTGRQYPTHYPYEYAENSCWKTLSTTSVM